MFLEWLQLNNAVQELHTRTAYVIRFSCVQEIPWEWTV